MLRPFAQLALWISLAGPGPGPNEAEIVQPDPAVASAADTSEAPASKEEVASAPNEEEVASAPNEEEGPEPDRILELADESALFYEIDQRPRGDVEDPLLPVEFTAGAMIVVRGQLTDTRSSEGQRSTGFAMPTRLRARLQARIDRFRLLAEFQDARVLDDPIGEARSGFHRLLLEYAVQGPNAKVTARAGRQEYVVGSLHLYGNAPWNQGMRSWDGLRLFIDLGRGGVDLFGGSLARPLLSSEYTLVEHVVQEVALTWVIEAHYEVGPYLTAAALVAGSHTRVPGDVRNVYTPSLRLTGRLAPGLRYQAEGHLQTGSFEIAGAQQKHLAGASYINLAYLAPLESSGGRSKLGGFVSFDYASGGRCTKTEFETLAPCTDGTNHDFEAPWMAHHRWFGNADRFRAMNVIDYVLGVRLENRFSRALRLNLSVEDHMLNLANPQGRWLDTGGRLVGLDADNRARWVANEVDVRARFSWEWLQLDVAWMLVANLAGGRQLSGEALRQFAYLWVTVAF